VFWDSTLREVEEVFDRIREEERSWNIRFGLVAATIVNFSPRKKGSRKVRPEDFWKDPGDHMAPKEAVTFMASWVNAVNSQLRKEDHGDRASTR